MTNYKNLFPIFEKQPELHYLDSGATTLKPKVVLEKMMEYYTEYSANIHRGLYPMSDRATTEYENVREKVAKFIGARTEEILFTSGTTSSLNQVAVGWGQRNLVEGDEIMVTETEHHSNFVPWQQLAKKKGLKFQIFPQGDFLRGANDKFQINKNTKLLAITHVSNVLGNINDIKSIIKKAREINPEICVVVDGAQTVGHMKVDVVDLDVDFYAFSGHKMYGPTGVGVLFGKKNRLLEMDPVNFGGGMINTVTLASSTWAESVEKFEGGTPPIAEVIGLGAAVDFINSIGWEEIVRHEGELTSYLVEEISELGWLEIMGEIENRLGIVAFIATKKNMGTAHDVADILGSDFNVCVRAGHHCAMPLHAKYDILTGSTRVSLGIYNEISDIDKLIEGLKEYERRFI